jgi:hypothetical protein
LHQDQLCRNLRHMVIIDVQADHGSRPSSKDYRVLDVIKLCDGAYSPNTMRGYAADLRAFVAWCARNDRAWLAASPQTVADFVDHEVEFIAASTLKRTPPVAAALRVRGEAVMLRS